MKSTYKFLMIIVVFTLQASLVLSQTLDEMHQNQRDSVLISIAKEVIIKFGPDYYREYQLPQIIRYIYPYNDVDKGVNEGRIAYGVGIPYDLSEEKLEYSDYAIGVGIWGDTQEPFSIRFGSGWVMDIPANWRTDMTIEPIPYLAMEIFPIWDLDHPENSEPRNTVELIERGWEKGSNGQWVKIHPDVPPYKSQYGGTFTSDITVNSLEIGRKYTKNEIIAALDTITSYNNYLTGFGLGEVYEYENCVFNFEEKGMFVGFFVDSDDFVIFEQYDGGIRVGDPITKVTELGIEGILQVQQNPGGGLVVKPPIKPGVIKPPVLSTTTEVYEFWMYDEVMIFTTELGLIVAISYSSSL